MLGLIHKYWMNIRAYIALVESEQNAALDEKRGRPNLGSAWVVIEDPETGDVLLGKRAKSANNSGQWNLFGGGIEGDETALQTALRELWEEAGIKVSPNQLYPIKTSPAGMTIFALSMSRKQVQKALRLNPKEVSKSKWFDMANLPKDLHKSALGLIYAAHSQDHAEVAMTNKTSTPSMRNMLDVAESFSKKKKP
ncbi:MAG: NUDIX hydrolase [Verrucomicrobiaceae bacterium]|nr:MAG: NUDIX hydrolase [Verrucomicrobiaceae bacterium]